MSTTTYVLAEKIEQLKEAQHYHDMPQWYDALVAELQPLQDVYPLEYAQARYERARVAHLLGHYEQALHDYTGCAEVLSFVRGASDVSYGLTMVAIAECYRDLKEPEKANATLRQAISGFQDQLTQEDLRFIQALDVQACLELDAGEAMHAQRAFSFILQMSPQGSRCQVKAMRAKVWFHFAQSCLALDNASEAEEALLQALSLYEEKHCRLHQAGFICDVYLSLSALYQTSGQHHQAMIYCNEGLRLSAAMFGRDSRVYVQLRALHARLLSDEIQDPLQTTPEALQDYREALDHALDFYGDMTDDDLQAVPDIADCAWHVATEKNENA